MKKKNEKNIIIWELRKETVAKNRSLIFPMNIIIIFFRIWSKIGLLL